MSEKDFDKLYEHHIEEGKKNGDVQEDSERRGHIRLKAHDTKLSVRAEVEVSAIDVSLSGLAFYSQFPVQIGQSLHITVGSLFTVEAEVISCVLVSSDPDFKKTDYKVQCRFFEEEQGKYLLVVVKEMEAKGKK